MEDNKKLLESALEELNKRIDNIKNEVEDGDLEKLNELLMKYFENGILSQKEIEKDSPEYLELEKIYEEMNKQLEIEEIEGLEEFDEDFSDFKVPEETEEK